MGRSSSNELTTPDLVLLSLLAERPMHGYEVNAELKRREVRDWAGISRPQVYYSLDKLARMRLISANKSDAPAEGPERNVFRTNTKGRTALGKALKREEWATQRERPPFLTWIALSWQAQPGIIHRQIQRRREFLEKELAREREVLQSVREEVEHKFHEAVWMLSLTIKQLQTELCWLKKLKREISRRAPAKNPQYFSKEDS